MEARDAVLARIRAALGGRVAPVEIPRAYRERGSDDEAERVARFVERVRGYEGSVVEADDPARAVTAVLSRERATSIVIAPDLPVELRPRGVELVVDDRLAATALDALDGALTTCAAACAETGTIALDGGPGQGRRAISLVPDLHVCIVRARQVVETVPELIATLEPSARAGRSIVLVSGPSATSDIGLERVEGVHGPRRLVVIVSTRDIRPIV